MDKRYYPMLDRFLPDFPDTAPGRAGLYFAMAAQAMRERNGIPEAAPTEQLELFNGE